MINFIRRLLRSNKFLYSSAARFYHFSATLLMCVSCRYRGIKFFSPRHPEGNYKSQFGQDYYLERLGLLSRGGFFVEIGSNDPVDNSNSYYLEMSCAYRGVSIDAIDYSSRFDSLRPNTEFINCLIDNHRESVDFYFVENVDGWENQVSSVYKATTSMGKGFNASFKTVPARRLSDICRHRGEIDILLLDVEGHEMNVLDSLDWSYSNPKVILVENNAEFYPRARLENYMRDKGYRLIARIGTSDDIYTK